MSHPALTYTPSAPTSYPPKMPARPRMGGATGAAPYAAQTSRYRDAELIGATPGQLIVMAYDKLLLTLRRARIACEADQIELRCEQLLKAGEIISELRISLDHAQGGQIAARLDALYGFMLRELLEANRKRDARKIDVVIRISSELHDAFAQIVAAGAGSVPAARSA